MGLSKTEINLRRLLVAAPQQQHQAKLIHIHHLHIVFVLEYVGTLKGAILAAEKTLEGLPRVSKATVSDYSEKFEVIAANLASQVLNAIESPELPTVDTFVSENTTKLKRKVSSLLMG